VVLKQGLPSHRIAGLFFDEICVLYAALQIQMPPDADHKNLNATLKHPLTQWSSISEQQVVVITCPAGFDSASKLRCTTVREEWADSEELYWRKAALESKEKPKAQTVMA